MSSPLSSRELEHLFFKRGGWKSRDLKLFPQCKPCGKYCTCAKAETDFRGDIHRRICCQCVERPSQLWNRPLKRVMCLHAPTSLDQIPSLVATQRYEPDEMVAAERPHRTVTSGSACRVVFVDMQSFQDEAGDIVVKELAAVELPRDGADAKVIFWTTVQSPFPLDESDRSYRYVRDRIHGLSWDEGLMSSDDASRLLRAAIYKTGSGEDRRNDGDNDVVVYAQGQEKTAFLADKVLAHENVENYAGPSLKRLQSSRFAPGCPTHSTRSQDLVCALDNCFKLAAHYKSTV